MIGGEDIIIDIASELIPDLITDTLDELVAVWPHMTVQWENSEDPLDPNNPSYYSCFAYKTGELLEDWELYGRTDTNANTLIQIIGTDSAVGKPGQVTFVVDSTDTLDPAILKILLSKLPKKEIN